MCIERRTLARLAALAALPLTLAACSTVEEVFGGDEAPIFCPRIVPVIEAQEMTRFDGSARDLTDVVFRARLADVRAECDADEEEIELAMAVTLAASRGPANESGDARFGYFVAVASADERILARNEYAVTIPFEGNRTNVGVIDQVDVAIPLAEGQTGREYRVYVGLTLNAAELEWNRQNR